MPEHSDSPHTPPTETKQIVVEDSPVKATIMTIFSLTFFGITLATTLIGLLKTGDIVAIRTLLLREETLSWLTAVAGLAWLAFRSVRTWWKTKDAATLADQVDDDVAVRKSSLTPIRIWGPQDPPPAPTRARETTTPTRLVDGAVLLYRGGPIAPPAPEPQPTFTYDGGAPSPTVIAGVDVSRRDPVPAAADDTAPRIPGDALDMPTDGARS